MGAVDDALNERQTLLEERGCRDQPFILLVGKLSSPNLLHYLVVERQMYRLSNFLQALDVTFKCFQALHASYPEESAQIWLLIQRRIYGIVTDWDYVVPSVATALTDLQG